MVQKWSLSQTFYSSSGLEIVCVQSLCLNKTYMYLLCATLYQLIIVSINKDNPQWCVESVSNYYVDSVSY